MRTRLLPLLLAAVAFGCSHKPSEESEASAEAALPPGSALAVSKAESDGWMDFIKLQAVQTVDAQVAVKLTGKVSFDEDRTQRVATPVDGRVLRVTAKLGDHVKSGQPLVELLSPQVAQLQADMQKTQQDFGVAEKSLQRAQKLKEEGAISEKEVSQAAADFKKAKSDLERAQAQMSVLSLKPTGPELTVALRAQVPGTVVERNVLVGQEVRADGAQPLLTVTDLSTVWVLADVYEQDLGLVSVGAKVVVHVPAYPDESFEGKVIHVGEVVDPMSRTVKVRCELPNPDGKLKPEMFAKVELQSAGSHAVLQVPDKAVLMDGDKSQVVIASNGKFSLRQVRVGPEVDGYIRVVEGLAPGDVVVTDGALFVRREIQD